MNNFWKKLNKPFFCLAPMADVTDAAFRRIIAKYSGDASPNGFQTGRVFWTEFVSADGLASQGREILLNDLKYTEAERPIVAQLFGANPEKMEIAARLVQELGFDGLDINMGCPDKTIEKQGAGAAMMKNPELAREIIRAAKRGAPDLPISVKTRLGFNKVEIETWLPELLKEDLAALTVHLRTRKEMSKAAAHWDMMPRVLEIVRASGKDTLVIGNGDVLDLNDAKDKIEKYGCDGVMLGRAIFGNPWLFAKREIFWSSPTPKRDKEEGQPDAKNFSFSSIQDKLDVMIEHTKLFEELLGEVKNFAIMKKHYKAYVNGFDGAKELRMKLMDAKDAAEVGKITEDFLAHF